MESALALTLADQATLGRIASLGFQSDEPNVVLPRILGELITHFNASAGTISLLNPDTGRLEIETQIGLPADYREVALRMGQGVTGWAAFHARAQLVTDVTRDLRYVRDLALLVRFTAEATAVLQRLWQIGHLKAKARQLETLITTGKSLVSKLEPQALFDSLTRDARQVVAARTCALYLYNPDSITLRCASLTSVVATPPPPGDIPLNSCAFAAVVHTRRAVSFANIRTPDFFDLVDLPGDPALISVLATPLLYEGEVLGVLAVFTERLHRFDNDEKRLLAALTSLGAVALQNSRLYTRVFQSEDSLRKNERLTTLGLLAAEIAHEIRNPLTVLKLLHGGLGVDFPPDDPRRTDMRVIGEKLDQLEAIVTRVLNFAKAPNSLHTRCPLQEIIEDTLVLLRLKLAQSKITLRFEPPARPLVVEGQQGQLQQVLLNLIINSMQAMPDGGTITLTLDAQLRESGPVAVVELSDTGTGIPDNIRDRIFDSFLSGRPGGTGLGLAIAKRVLNSHYGDLTLVTSSPAGTTMRLTLPLA
ncbi:MAG: GAF domain-containing protein [Verrucomicrobia bacterium]|nr:GAF domain-containing protein [Verrucomicrobiota bacterium]